MKSVLNRLKTAFLFKVLAGLSWLSAKIRAKVGVDYAIRGSIVANRSRSIPRPPMTLISREFSRRKFTQPIEFDSDDLSSTDSQ